MAKEKSKILVRDVQTKQVLFEGDLADSERAYQFAAEMEEMGLDIEVVSPTLGETLSSSLGLTREEQAAYKNSLEEEMESHEGSCCFEDSDKKIVH
jgi:hypothetical protein